MNAIGGQWDTNPGRGGDFQGATRLILRGVVAFANRSEADVHKESPGKIVGRELFRATGSGQSILTEQQPGGENRS